MLQLSEVAKAWAAPDGARCDWVEQIHCLTAVAAAPPCVAGPFVVGHSGRESKRYGVGETLWSCNIFLASVLEYTIYITSKCYHANTQVLLEWGIIYITSKSIK